MDNDKLEEMIFDKYGGAGSISEVPEPARTVLAIYAAQGVIDHGGLGYFFEADFPSDDAYEVIAKSYRNIDMAQKADALEKVLSLFPEANPHANLDERQVFLNKYFDYGNLHPTVSWAEDVLDGSYDGVYEKALNYYRENT